MMEVMKVSSVFARNIIYVVRVSLSSGNDGGDDGTSYNALDEVALFVFSVRQHASLGALNKGWKERKIRRSLEKSCSTHTYKEKQQERETERYTHWP